MTEISAALVKELRDATGAGMMDCKRALAGDGRRLRRGRQAPAREGHGLGREARRPRDERGQGRLPARATTSARDRRRRLRDRAGLEQRRVPRVRARRCSRPSSSTAARPRRARGRAGRADGEARREHRRRRREAHRGGGRRACSPPTSTRRRTRSACSCTKGGGSDDARAQPRAAHRRSRADVRRATRCPRSRRRRSARSSRTRTRSQSKPENVREKIVEGMLNKRFFGEACSPSRRGSTTRRRRSARRCRTRAPRCSSSSASRWRLVRPRTSAGEPPHEPSVVSAASC